MHIGVSWRRLNKRRKSIGGGINHGVISSGGIIAKERKSMKSISGGEEESSIKAAENIKENISISIKISA